jgi:uncharacterized HAD superfamily protein
MKYMITKFKSFNIDIYGVTTTSDDINFLGFPVEVGNPNYDAFLTQAELTDEQVHELKPDVWYDFPEGDK